MKSISTIFALGSSLWRDEVDLDVMELARQLVPALLSRREQGAGESGKDVKGGLSVREYRGNNETPRGSTHGVLR